MTHLVRRPFPNIYFFRLWLLRYQQWLVIICLFYKPLTRRQKLRRTRKAHVTIQFVSSNSWQLNLNHQLRLKLFVSFIATKALQSNVMQSNLIARNNKLLF